MKTEKEKLSIFISLVLRHKPDAAGLKLDEHGWADVDELIKKIANTGREINMAILEDIVETDNKTRYSFNEDKTKIRANQGHSVKVDVQLKEAIPPETLYHGTAERFIGSITKEGLVHGNRLHVHLSDNKETAKNVGSRHGNPVVLKIRAKEMYDAGHKFYISENGVWLCEQVANNYIEV